MTNYFFSASLSPATGNDAVWILKDTLVQAGWVVVSSSDATTFSSGDVLTASSDLANSNAWFVVKQPLGATGSHGGVRREYAFQRGTNSLSWRAKYSYSASFTGSANATTLPDALDQVRLIGTELPNFSFETFYFDTDGSYTLHVAADQDPPYSWYFVQVEPGGANIDVCWISDGMVSGTFDPGDVDPYVNYCADGSSVLDGLTASNTVTHAITSSIILTPAAWFAKNTPSEVYGGVAAMAYGFFLAQQQEFADDKGRTNHITGNDDLLPVFWFRPATANPSGPGGYKGASSLLKSPAGPVRSNGSTYSIATSSSKDFIRLGDFAFPWDGTNPLV